MADTTARPASGTALPATMRAAVCTSAGGVTIDERPVPVPGDGQVLVAVEHCGICGSDIHLILDGWGTAGVVEGHEWTGVVAAVGPDVDRWQVGDQVLGGPPVHCGRCRPCREGRPSRCEDGSMTRALGVDGAFADFVLVDARRLLAIPPGLSPRVAALAEPLAVALHALSQGGVGPVDSVLVLGAGPIGALAIAALAARGAPAVVAVEPLPARQELARRLGAHRVLDPGALDTFPIWEPERMAEQAVDVVLECSGKKVAMEAGLSQLRRGGRLVLVGAGIEPPSFDPNRILLNELTVTGSFNYDEHGFEEALALLTTDGFPVDELIAPDDVPLDRLGDALRDLADGRIAAKAMVAPRLRSGEVER